MSLADALNERRRSGRSIPTSSSASVSSPTATASLYTHLGRQHSLGPDMRDPAASSAGASAAPAATAPASAPAPAPAAPAAPSAPTAPAPSAGAGPATTELRTLSGTALHTFVVNHVSFTVDKRYVPDRALGRGSSGVVALCIDTLTGKSVAIKKIPDVFASGERAKRCLREMRLLHRLGAHHHIVHLFDLIEPVAMATFDDIYVVMEYMETDLYRTITSTNRLGDEHLQYFIYQLLCGLNFCHSAGVIHRDMKPSNILLNRDCRLKICDFGLARGVPETEAERLTEYVVTRWYRAPEVICADVYERGVDVWSVGCILAELLGRKPLFRGQDYVEQINLIVDVVGSPTADDLKFVTNPDALDYLMSLTHREKKSLAEMYPNASPLAIDLLEKLLQFNPEKRISVEGALAHPYLKRYHNKDAGSEAPFPADNPIDFSFERASLTKSQLRELFLEQIRAVKQDQKTTAPRPHAAEPASTAAAASTATPATTAATAAATTPPAAAPAASSSSSTSSSSSASVPGDAAAPAVSSGSAPGNDRTDAGLFSPVPSNHHQHRELHHRSRHHHGHRHHGHHHHHHHGHRSHHHSRHHDDKDKDKE